MTRLCKSEFLEIVRDRQRRVERDLDWASQPGYAPLGILTFDQFMEWL